MIRLLLGFWQPIIMSQDQQTDDEEQHKINITEAVIAELCAGTTNTDIKNCIQIYEYGKAINNMKQEMMQLRKAKLEATFEYLKRPNEFTPVTKKDIVNDIICRIQNFLPETCDMCNSSYMTKHGDAHLLSCALCNQEVHKPN